VEIENSLDVFSGPFLVGVVSAIGQDHELSEGKVPVKRQSLFHVKDETPVRVNDEAWADHGAKCVPQVKVILSVSPSEQAELVEEWFRKRFSVPVQKFLLQLRIEL
jgi:hypothetical protein